MGVGEGVERARSGVRFAAMGPVHRRFLLELGLMPSDQLDFQNIWRSILRDDTTNTTG